MAVEEAKPKREQGYYIHPELFGAPPEIGIEARRILAEREKDLPFPIVAAVRASTLVSDDSVPKTEIILPTRCGAKNSAWHAMPVSRDAKRAVQASRWPQYRSKDAGRYRPHPDGRYEARAILEASEGGTEVLSWSGDAVD